MQQQHSLFKDDHGVSARPAPAMGTTINRVVGTNTTGRKLSVDKINDIARQAGLRLTTVNAASEDNHSARVQGKLWGLGVLERYLFAPASCGEVA